MLQRFIAWRRARADRGAVAVEAALVIPVLLLIVVAITEFGLAYKDQLAVTSAVRAGARMASAEPRIATFAQDAADAVAREGAALDLTQVTALWVYKADTSGNPPSSCSTNCISFSYSSATKKFVQSSGSWAYTSQDACVGEQDSVGVYLAYKHSAITHVLFSSVSLTSRTVMRLEPIPSMQTGGCK